MFIINLFGGPGIGKTVLAADLFSILAKRGHNTELILEYAKSCFYENRMNILKEDQFYVLAKQHRSIARLKNHNVEYVVVDGPMEMSAAYNNPDNFDQPLIEQTIKYLHSNYKCLNVLLERNPAYGFNPVGRYQKNMDEAIKYDTMVVDTLKSLGLPYISHINNVDIIPFILKYAVVLSHD